VCSGLAVLEILNSDEEGKIKGGSVC